MRKPNADHIVFDITNPRFDGQSGPCDGREVSSPLLLSRIPVRLSAIYCAISNIGPFRSSPNGVGFHTALQMAAKGATVYLGARNAAKYQSAAEEMIKSDPSIGTNQIRPFIADLGDLKAVKTAAEKLMTGTDRLDILVNNAGLYVGVNRLTLNRILMCLLAVSHGLWIWILTASQ
jgi:hypothetical protein